MIWEMQRRLHKYIIEQEERLKREKLGIFPKISLIFQLFFSYLLAAIFQAAIIFFSHPTRSFVVLYPQDERGTWHASYHRHVLYQRNLRVFSLSSFLAIITAAIIVQLILSYLFPPTSIEIARGAIFTVTNCNDSGSGSLREAINNATISSQADTITFSTGGGCIINLSSDLPLLTSDGDSINGDNDGKGVILDGQNIVSSGLTIKASNNLITNLTIRNFTGNGITIADGNDNIIQNNTIYSNGGHGIVLTSEESSAGGASDNTISNNDIGTDGGNAGSGIFANYNSDNNIIENNTISNNTLRGINLEWGPSENSLEDNVITNNGGIGINLPEASNNTISGNTLNNNGGPEIVLNYSADNNNITGNVITNDNDEGISIDEASNTTIQDNVISTAGSHGIEIQAGSNNVIDGNHIGIDENGADIGPGEGENNNGIWIHGDNVGDNNEITNNVIANNLFGIFLQASNSENNTIQGNIIQNNDSGGIYIEGSSGNIIGMPLDSTDTTLGNTITNNDVGVDFQDGTTNNIVRGNLIYGNIASDIHINEGSQENMYLASATVDGANAEQVWGTVDLSQTEVASITRRVLQTGDVLIDAYNADTGRWLGSTYTTDEGGNFTLTFNNPLTEDTTIVFILTKVINSSLGTGVSSNYKGITEVDATAPVCSASPATGEYAEAQMVTISCDDLEAIIYYTTDGTDPNTSSNIYSGPITVSSTTTLKFIGVDSVDNESEIYTETYTIIIPDKTAPKISNIKVTTTASSAEISFDTDEAAVNKIFYGQQTDWTSEYRTSHSVTLSSLSPKTTYEYYIKVKDAAGNSRTSLPRKFTTEKEVTIPFGTSLEGIRLPDDTKEEIKVYLGDETERKLTFSGTSEAGYTVMIKAIKEKQLQAVNDEISETTTTESDGTFAADLELSEGNWKIYLKIKYQGTETDWKQIAALKILKGNFVDSPKPGEIIFAETVTFTGTGEEDETVRALVDREKQTNETTIGVDKTFTLESDTLSYDGHQGTVWRKNDQRKISPSIKFTTASAETTDRLRIYAKKVDRPLDEANVTYSTQPIFYGNAPAGTVQLYIDGELTKEITSSGLNYRIALDEALDYGQHSAVIKVLDNSGQQIWHTEPFAFLVYRPWPKATFGELVDNRYLPIFVRDGSYVEVEIDGKLFTTATAEDTGTGTASFALDLLSYQDGKTYQITVYTSQAENRPYVTAKTEFTLEIPASTPAAEEEVSEEEQPAEEEKPTEEKPTEQPDSDNDGLTDEEEEELGTDPNNPDTDQDTIPDKEEEEIKEKTKEKQEKDKKKKEEQLQKEAKKNLVPVYPTITEEEITLTTEEKVEVQQALQKSIAEATTDITFVGQILPEEKIDGTVKVSLPRTVDLNTILRRLFKAEEEIRTKGEIIFSGKINLPEKLKGLTAYVILTIYSEPIVQIAQAAENGQWTITVPLDLLSSGEHTAWLGSEVNGVQSGQVQIARFVIEEKPKLSSTTILFLVNVLIAIILLMFAIALQLRKNRQYLKEHQGEITPPPTPLSPQPPTQQKLL